MKSTSKSYIEASKDAITRLSKVFECTEKMVYMSLTYRKNSDLAKKIRYVAVSKYGGEPMRHCPECETMFEERKDGRPCMCQYFKNGAELVWWKGTSDVTVSHKNTKHVYHDVTLPELSKIQLMAESL